MKHIIWMLALLIFSSIVIAATTTDHIFIRWDAVNSVSGQGYVGRDAMSTIYKCAQNWTATYDGNVTAVGLRVFAIVGGGEHVNVTIRDAPDGTVLGWGNLTMTATGNYTVAMTVVAEITNGVDYYTQTEGINLVPGSQVRWYDNLGTAYGGVADYCEARKEGANPWACSGSDYDMSQNISIVHQVQFTDIVSLEPDNNTQFSSLDEINLTLNNTLTGICELNLTYPNGTKYLKNVSYSSVNASVEFNASAGNFPSLSLQGKYNYSVHCFNGSYEDSSDVRIFYFDDDDPSLTWYEPQSMYIIGSFNYWRNFYYHNFTTNITVSDSYLDSFQINISNSSGVMTSFTNTTITETSYAISRFYNILNFSVDDYNVSVSACDNLNGSMLNCVTETYPFYSSNTTDIYTTPENGNTITTLYLNLTNNRKYYDGEFSARVNYNGTWYNASYTPSNTSNHLQFSADITTPTSTLDMNVTFYWNFSVPGQEWHITNSTTQEILGLDMDNCSSYGYYAINFTIRNETNTSSPLEGSIRGYFELWNDAMSNSTSFNLTWDGSPYHQLCLAHENVTYNIHAQLEYFDTNQYLATKTYYFYNASVQGNNTENVSLYLTEGTTQIKFLVRDENDNPLNDVYVQVLSYDLGSDSSKVTEIVKTDDDGTAYAQMVLNTKWYQFLAQLNGVTRLFADERKVTSTELIFRLQLETDYFDNYDIRTGVGHSLIFDDTTNTFTFIFSDASGNVNTGCLELKKLGAYADIVENVSCVTSSSGSISLTTATTTGEYFATGYININPTFTLDSLSHLFNTPGLGTDGILLVIALMITMVMAGIWHPAVSIIFAVAALILSVITGLWVMTLGSVLTIVIISGIAVYKMRTP